MGIDIEFRFSFGHFKWMWSTSRGRLYAYTPYLGIVIITHGKQNCQQGNCANPRHLKQETK